MIRKWIKKRLAPIVREVIAEDMDMFASELSNSNPSMPRIRRQHLSRAALEQHYDTTVGLWVIDCDPREVSKEWIDENAYQIMGVVTTRNGL